MRNCYHDVDNDWMSRRLKVNNYEKLNYHQKNTAIEKNISTILSNMKTAIVKINWCINTWSFFTWISMLTDNFYNAFTHKAEGKTLFTDLHCAELSTSFLRDNAGKALAAHQNWLTSVVLFQNIPKQWWLGRVLFGCEKGNTASFLVCLIPLAQKLRECRDVDVAEAA